MHRLGKALFCAVLAIVAMGATASIASATGRTVSISGPGTTTATATNLTLTGSAVGTVIGNVTLGLTVRTGTIDCTAGALVPIATVGSGGVTISTPSGASASLLLPWTVNGQCDASGNIILDGATGLPLLSILGIGFNIRLNAISSFLYSGSVNGILNASPAGLLTILSSTLRATPGGSTGALRGSFTLSPAISYSII